MGKVAHLNVAPEPDPADPKVFEPEQPDTPPRRRGSLSDASNLGKREQLIALRDRLASIIDDPSSLARDVASLSIRYMKVVEAISVLDDAEVALEGDALGEAADSPDEGFDPSSV